MRGPTHHPLSRSLVSTLSLVALSTLAACGKSDKAPSPDSTARAAAPVRALAAAGKRSPGRTYPGALTKPIDAYTGDELFELTRSLQYVGSHERERNCKDSPDCGPGGAKKTLVQVSGVATEDSLTAGDVPEFGAVYTRAINRGDATEARYGLRPGNTLRYYMIVQRDSAGALRWRLEELTITPPRRHVQIGSGVVTDCGHGWKPGARADFKTCDAPERGDTVVTLALSMQGFNDPMWMGCGTGCCTY